MPQDYKDSRMEVLSSQLSHSPVSRSQSNFTHPQFLAVQQKLFDMTAAARSGSEMHSVVLACGMVSGLLGLLVVGKAFSGLTFKERSSQARPLLAGSDFESDFVNV